LHKLYIEIFALYKVITSPDVDIEKFTTLLLDSIAKLKHQSGLDRCKNAFKRIEDSVELLKTRFDDYYRESIAASNPNMIVESFIVDVSNKGGGDARLTREFRVIIQHMHKVSQQNGRIKDPNVQKLFKLLNQNYKLMEESNGQPAAGLDLTETKENPQSKNLSAFDISLKSDVNSSDTSDDVTNDQVDFTDTLDVETDK
jgi:hypothetical protein